MAQSPGWKKLRQYGQRILVVGLTGFIVVDTPIYFAVLLDLPNEMTDFTVNLRSYAVRITRFIVMSALTV